MRNTSSLILILPMSLFLIVFFYIPLVAILYNSIVYDGRISLGNYLEIVREPAYFKVVTYSITVALQVALASLILGAPVAYYVATLRSQKEKTILLVLLVTPMWIDFLAKGLAIRTLLRLIGVGEGRTAMIIGMIYEYLPLMILLAYVGMSRITPNIIDAARVLGAPRSRIIRDIILPLSLPGIMAGAVIVAMMALTEYVVPALLGGTEGYTVGVLLYHLFLSGGDWGVGSALAVIVTTATLAAVIVANRRIGGEMH